MKEEGSFSGRWTIIGVSFATLALSYTAMYSFSIFFVALLKEFGWSRSVTAGAYSFFMILHGMMGPLVGGLIDRFGARKVFLGGSLFLGAGLALCSLIRSWWQFYLFFSVITSLGVTATGWVPNTTVIQNYFRQKRGLAMGIISSGTGVGILVFVPAIQHLINGVGWRRAYLIMAILIPLSIICMVLIILRSRPTTPLPDPEENRKSFPEKEDPRVVDDGWPSGSWTLRQAVFTKQFWALGTCFFFTTMISQSMLTHQVAFWVDEGMEVLFASYLVGIIGIVSIAGKISWATLSDKVGREVTYTLVLGCSMIGMVSLITFTVLPTPSLPYFYAVFFGLGYAGTASLPPLITADFFEGPNYGKIFGAVFVFNGTGGAFGAWIAGFLHDHMKSYVPVLIMMIACALLACLIVWLAAPRKLRAKSV
jgi:MFS family permease